ncbi:hypothetical protein HID58_021886 [Brassica napus]|uniref:Uncharacterized protein n=1 Tax=Brassica napus TaxID=3708 RepID=A0ABQ8CXQ1_BRANA|nr:hypothetical protein HID58_021886 [Brassica napus]
MCSDMVVEIAMRWTKVLITGGLGLRFMAVDRSTVMFNMQNGKEVTELREFVLSQKEAYEVNIWKQEFRRPGDPPLDNATEERYRNKGAYIILQAPDFTDPQFRSFEAVTPRPKVVVSESLFFNFENVIDSDDEMDKSALDTNEEQASH